MPSGSSTGLKLAKLPPDVKAVPQELCLDFSVSSEAETIFKSS
jgi:hypothetical protein